MQQTVVVAVTGECKSSGCSSSSSGGGSYGGQQEQRLQQQHKQLQWVEKQLCQMGQQPRRRQ